MPHLPAVWQPKRYGGAKSLTFVRAETFWFTGGSTFGCEEANDWHAEQLKLCQIKLHIIARVMTLPIDSVMTYHLIR